MPATIAYSEHAQVRMAQRGLSQEDVEYVCRYGRLIRGAGALHRFLGRKDIPLKDHKHKCRLEGTIVLLDEMAKVVITVYRNRQGLKGIRCKQR